MDAEPDVEALAEWKSKPAKAKAMTRADAERFARVLKHCASEARMPRATCSNKAEAQAAEDMATLRDTRKSMGDAQLQELAEAIAAGAKEKAAKSMWFLPAVESTVTFSSTEKYTVRRCGFQASHAMFLTSTASQGQTLRVSRLTAPK